MKKVISLVLTICLVFTFFSNPVTIVNATGTYSDAELARAVELGFGEYRENDAAVTYADFMKMLDRTVELTDKAKLAGWKARHVDARKSNRAVLRCEAAVLLYLAGETLGESYTVSKTEYYYTVVRPTNPDDPVFDLRMNEGDYSLFDVDVYADTGTKYTDNFYNAEAYYTMFALLSPISSKPVLETGNNSTRLTEKLTYQEAMLAALRLHDSGIIESERYPNEEDERILAEVEARKREILNSTTTVKVTGTKYYVSADGDDSNDGKTPETPWLTLDKVTNANLKPGDGVFFKRGDLWRDQRLTCQEGVTYSAYGEGDKPLFYGSPENGAGASKWKLASGTNNIWEFYKPMRNTGAIVFNEGETFADKALVTWDGAKYVAYTCVHDYENVNSPFSIKDMDNMIFHNDIDYTSAEEIHYLDAEKQATHNMAPSNRNDLQGKLYLRCDAGNPGEVFDSIEFCVDAGPDTAFMFGIHAPGVTLDNIAIKYMSHGVDMGVDTTQQYYTNDFSTGALRTVQNCEIGWAAGTTERFVSKEVNGKTMYFAIHSGDAFHLEESNNLIQNSYLYEAYDSVIGLEVSPTYMEFDQNKWAAMDVTWENHTIRGNVIERANSCILTMNWEDPAIPNHVMKNITIEDNYILYGGYGHSIGRSRKVTGASFGDDYTWGSAMSSLPYYPNINENFKVMNNVFYLASKELFSYYFAEEDYPDFEGNTYVTNNYGRIATWRMPDGSIQEIYNGGVNTDDFIRDILGDTTGTVLPPSF